MTLARWLWVWCLALLFVSCDKLLPPPGEDAFLAAAAQGEHGVVDRYLAAGGNPDAVNAAGDTALCLAAFEGDAVLVEKLIAAGAGVSLAGAKERQPFYYAALGGHWPVFAKLRSAGADMDAGNAAGKTPLMAAAGEDRREAVRWLLNNGADINAGDRNGYTALIFALVERNGAIVEDLVLAGADLSAGGKINALSLAVSYDLTHLLQTEKIQERYPHIGRRLADANKEAGEAPRAAAQEAKETLYMDTRPLYRTEILAELLHREINGLRQKKGLAPFTRDPELDKVARAHAEDMPARGFFGVANPDGANPLQRVSAIREVRSDASLDISENLYKTRLYSGSSESVDGAARVIRRDWLSHEALVESILRDWRASPKNAKPLLSEGGASHGLGLAIDHDERLYVVQDIVREISELKVVYDNEAEKPRLDPEALAREIARLVNDMREKEGLVALDWDAALAAASVEHSKDMAAGDYLDHTGRSGESPTRRAIRHGYVALGEAGDFNAMYRVGEHIYRRAVYANAVVRVEGGIKTITRQWVDEKALAGLIIADLAKDPDNKGSMLSQLHQKHGTGIAFDNQNRVYLTHKFVMMSLSDLSGFEVVARGSGPDVSSHAFRMMVHDLVNKQRLEHGLKALEWDDALSVVALKHSQDMARNKYFSHRDLRGDRATERAMRRGYVVSGSIGNTVRAGIGENLFRDVLFTNMLAGEEDGRKTLRYEWRSLEDLARGIVEGWMSSPGHRRNLLNGMYVRQGIGVAVGEGEMAYVAQNFF